MSPEIQTVAALVVVALAAAWLLWRLLGKRSHPGCGDDCGAVSPEIKRLQKRLRAR